MRTDERGVAAVRVELLLTHPAAEMERRVEGERRVSLREHEAVAVRSCGIGDRECLPVEPGQDVRNRERRADVPDLRPIRLLDDDAPDRACELPRGVHAMLYRSRSRKSE